MVFSIKHGEPNLYIGQTQIDRLFGKTPIHKESDEHMQ
ncbi:unnamed protein product, partial [Rotaria sp. Silwood1]